MSRKSLVSFDKETYLIGTDYPEPIGYQGLAPRPVCLAYLYSSQKALHAHLASDYDHMSELMHTWLKDDNMTMLGQNVPFDMAVAVKHLGVPIDLVFEKYDKGLVKDTQIRETLLALATGEAVKNPAKRYNLAAMVDKYLGKDISESKGADAWRLRYSELDGVPLQDWPVEASEYPKDDVRHTLKVFAHQHKHKLFFQTNEKAQTAAAWDLHLISMNSPRVDPPMIDVFESNHDVQAAEAKAPLIEKGIMKPNPNRYKDFPKGDPRRAGHSMNKKLLQKVVQADYTRQGRVVPATEKGDISLAGDTLKGCRSKELREYGEAAGDIKMMDAFVPMLRRAAASHERRVTPRYGVILKTGRTSASSPNLQQQPKASGARECFIPEEGHVFVSIDFSSMEMYCLAQSAKMLYGTTKLLEVLNSGKDPHLMAVEGISGMGYAEMDAKKQAGDKMVGKYRALAKIMNFGFGGGMGGKTATSNLAEYERDTIRDLFPGEKIVSVMDRLSKQWKYTWELMPMFEKAGRLCRGGNRPTYTCPITGRIKALNTYCQYCNMHFQPIGADALKEALRLVTRACYSETGSLYQYGIKIAVEIHDELLLSGPPETMHIWVPEIQRLMQEGAMRILTDCKIQTEAEVCGIRWRKVGVSIQDWKLLEEAGLDGEDYFAAKLDNGKLSVVEYFKTLENQS